MSSKDCIIVRSNNIETPGKKSKDAQPQNQIELFNSSAERTLGLNLKAEQTNTRYAEDANTIDTLMFKLSYKDITSSNLELSSSQISENLLENVSENGPLKQTVSIVDILTTPGCLGQKNSCIAKIVNK